MQQLKLLKLFREENLRKRLDDRYVISLGDIHVYTNPMYISIHSRGESGIDWLIILDNGDEPITPEMILEDLKSKTSRDKLFVKSGEVILDPLSDTSYTSMANYNNLASIFYEFDIEYEGYLDYVDHNIDEISYEWPNFKW